MISRSINGSSLKTDRKIRFHSFLSLHRDVGMLKNCDKTQCSIHRDSSVEFYVIINNIRAEKHRISSRFFVILILYAITTLHFNIGRIPSRLAYNTK